jgi:predicted nucleic acid-binding Zn ribbon protein
MALTIAIEKTVIYSFCCDSCGEINELEEDEREAGFVHCRSCDTGFRIKGSVDDGEEDNDEDML